MKQLPWIQTPNFPLFFKYWLTIAMLFATNGKNISKRLVILSRCKKRAVKRSDWKKWKAIVDDLVIKKFHPRREMGSRGKIPKEGTGIMIEVKASLMKESVCIYISKWRHPKSAGGALVVAQFPYSIHFWIFQIFPTTENRNGDIRLYRQEQEITSFFLFFFLSLPFPGRAIRSNKVGIAIRARPPSLKTRLTEDLSSSDWLSLRKLSPICVRFTGISFRLPPCPLTVENSRKMLILEIVFSFFLFTFAVVIFKSQST